MKGIREKDTVRAPHNPIAEAANSVAKATVKRVRSEM
jgi:hypothetical protein